MNADQNGQEATQTSPRRRPVRRNRRKLYSWIVVISICLAAACAVLSQVGLWRTRVALEGRHHESASVWLSVAGICWPRNAEWYYLNTILMRRTQDFDAVEVNLKKAHELGWVVRDLQREQTLALAQTGQFHGLGNKWSELFQSAGADGPEICDAYIRYALSRFRLDEAATVLEGWKTDFPNDPGPWIVEGTITSVHLKWDKAEESFRRALDLAPANDEAKIKLAKALIKQLKFVEAESWLRAVAKGEASSPDVVVSLAHCVAQQGRLDEALDSLQAALQQQPDNVNLLGELGRLQLMANDNQAAIDSLNPVLQQQPENTEIRYALAQALRNNGDEQQAQEHFRLVDEGTKALRELSRLTAVVAANPADVETRYKVGLATWKWKSRKDGLAWLLSVLEFDPDHKPTHALLAQHYEEESSIEKAEHHKRLAESN